MKHSRCGVEQTAADTAEELTAIHYEAARNSGLESEYRNDPVLLKLYMLRLPRKRWAGSRTATEKKYCSILWGLKGNRAAPTEQ